MFLGTGIVLCDVGKKTETVIDLTMDQVDVVDKEETIPLMENKQVNDVVDEKKAPEKTSFEFDMLEEKDFLAVGDTLNVVPDLPIAPEVSKKRKADDEEQDDAV